MVEPFPDVLQGSVTEMVVGACDPGGEKYLNEVDRFLAASRRGTSPSTIVRDCRMRNASVDRG